MYIYIYIYVSTWRSIYIYTYGGLCMYLHGGLCAYMYLHGGLHGGLYMYLHGWGANLRHEVKSSQPHTCLRRSGTWCVPAGAQHGLLDCLCWVGPQRNVPFQFATLIASFHDPHSPLAQVEAQPAPVSWHWQAGDSSPHATKVEVPTLRRTSRQIWAPGAPSGLFLVQLCCFFSASRRWKKSGSMFTIWSSVKLALGLFFTGGRTGTPALLCTSASMAAATGGTLSGARGAVISFLLPGACRTPTQIRKTSCRPTSAESQNHVRAANLQRPPRLQDRQCMYYTCKALRHAFSCLEHKASAAFVAALCAMQTNRKPGHDAHL